jgi:hypothetical protein
MVQDDIYAWHKVVPVDNADADVMNMAYDNPSTLKMVQWNRWEVQRSRLPKAACLCFPFFLSFLLLRPFLS